MNIYEVHLGSWRCGLPETGENVYESDQNDRSLSYRDLAQQLVDYVYEMGYTHIELLPVSEHPYDGSWGYQATGYFSVTSRYGNPHDFMYFVDCCHQKGLGVILDWVPAHFCKDDCGLRRYDGSALYENENSLRGENVQWGTANFDFSKNEVWSFLISNAYFWFDVYHIDGLRVDAVAYILYLDYCKQPGQWLPNKYNGPENLEAIEFMKKLNLVIFENFPEALMIAEEATHWPMVTYPTYLGGLGYNYKWNMGWMNDILDYMKSDPLYRKDKHSLLTFSLMYAFSENYVLPLSHDEVVHGKKSLINKMPGDYWQKFANLRLLYAYMMAHPGKKLLFMGGEFGQFIEWSYKESLDWHLLVYEMHGKLHSYVKDLNHIYLDERCLWEEDGNWNGFSWIDPHDSERSIITFIRRASNEEDFIIVVCNFTPVVRDSYLIGVPQAGVYQEVFNSDNEKYGGSGQKNNRLIFADEFPYHGLPHSMRITIPPLAVVYLKRIKTKQSCTGRGKNAQGMCRDALSGREGQSFGDFN
jgi:1,4-alpha-glucan branching enzyme